MEEVTEKDKKGKTVKVQKEVGKIYNIQVQANKQSKVTSIKGLAPKTVSGPVIIELKNGKYSLSATEVRSELTSKMLTWIHEWNGNLFHISVFFVFLKRTSFFFFFISLYFFFYFVEELLLSWYLRRRHTAQLGYCMNSSLME